MLRTVMLGSVKDACSRAGTELSFVGPQKLARPPAPRKHASCFAFSFVRWRLPPPSDPPHIALPSLRGALIYSTC